MEQTAPLAERLKRFARSCVVGAAATVVDLLVLELCRRAIGMPWVWAKVFAVAAGTATQFIGSRHYAFRAQQGRIGRQLKWFLLAEASAFALTVLVFHGLASYLPLPEEFASLLSGSVVYFGFSYPIWKWVFRVAPGEVGTESCSAATDDALEETIPLDTAV